MKYLYKAYELVQIVAAVVVAVICLGIFLRVFVAPIAPVITVLLLALFTLLACSRWTTAILAVAGIVLYAASWPAVHAWGTLPGMSIWAVGIIVWFAAVFKSVAHQFSVTVPVTAS